MHEPSTPPETLSNAHSLESSTVRQVKSMQMFRRPVQRCAAGDRVGVCVTQLESKSVERGIACAPGSVPIFTGAVAAVEKIRFFQGAGATRSSNDEGHVLSLSNASFWMSAVAHCRRSVSAVVLKPGPSAHHQTEVNSGSPVACSRC